MRDDGQVVVARIGRPHGIRGEVSLELRTDEPDRRLAPGAVLTAQHPRGAATGLPATLTVARSRWHQERLLVTFEDGSQFTVGENAEVVLDDFLYKPRRRNGVILLDEAPSAVQFAGVEGSLGASASPRRAGAARDAHGGPLPRTP